MPVDGVRGANFSVLLSGIHAVLLLKITIPLLTIIDAGVTNGMMLRWLDNGNITLHRRAVYLVKSCKP